MQTQPVNFPVYLDADKNPALEPFALPLVKDPSEIRWSREKQNWYQVMGMPHIYCDGSMLLLDRTIVEVQMWLLDKSDIDALPVESVQNVVKECPSDGLNLLPQPLAYSAASDSAAWVHFDVGLDEPLSLNAEAYTWLKHEGYELYVQPDQRIRTSRVILRRRSEGLAGVLMPGNGRITIRQIYTIALKPPYAIFDLMGARMADKEAEKKMLLQELAQQRELEDRCTPKGFKTAKHAASESFEFIEKLYDSGKYSDKAVFTGYFNIDSMLGGIPLGNIAVAAGDGVSAFLRNVVRKNALRLKKPVVTAVFCLQKALPELAIHLMCLESSLMTKEITRGMLRVSDWSRLSSSAGLLSDNQHLCFSEKLPASIIDMMDCVKACKEEQPALRLVVLENLELITGDDKIVIADGLKNLKLLADNLGISILIGSSSNIKFKQHKRNHFERYADVLLLLRKNEQNYTTEIVDREIHEAHYDYNEHLRGHIKIKRGGTILVKYPVEVQVRTRDELLGTAILQYLPQKGVFVNGK